MMRSIIRSKTVRTTAAALFWILVWQLLYVIVGKDILIASPLQVLQRLGVWLIQEKYLRIIFSSVGRILAGFGAALVVGTLLAALTAASPLCRGLFRPLVAIVRAVPVASFIILVLVWVHSAYVPSVITFLTVTPIIWENIARGIEETDRNLLEVAKMYHFSRRKQLRWIYVPSVLPYFATACSTGLGFAWKSGVAAEVIAVTKMSIGSMIYESKIYLETADLFAWTVIVIAISMLIEYLFTWVLRRILKQRPTRKEQDR